MGGRILPHLFFAFLESASNSAWAKHISALSEYFIANGLADSVRPEFRGVSKLDVSPTERVNGPRDIASAMRLIESKKEPYSVYGSLRFGRAVLPRVIGFSVLFTSVPHATMRLRCHGEDFHANEKRILKGMVDQGIIDFFYDWSEGKGPKGEIYGKVSRMYLAFSTEWDVDYFDWFTASRAIKGNDNISNLLAVADDEVVKSTSEEFARIEYSFDSKVQFCRSLERVTELEERMREFWEAR